MKRKGNHLKENNIDWFEISETDGRRTEIFSVVIVNWTIHFSFSGTLSKNVFVAHR